MTSLLKMSTKIKDKKKFFDCFRTSLKLRFQNFKNSKLNHLNALCNSSRMMATRVFELKKNVLKCHLYLLKIFLMKLQAFLNLALNRRCSVLLKTGKTAEGFNNQSIFNSA